MSRNLVLSRIDLRMVFIVLALMIISLLIISASTVSGPESDDPFFTRATLNQLQWFVIGGGVFVIFAALDYNKLREWTWILYVLMIVALIGVFFSGTTRGVQRWFKVPGIGVSFQPSEFAKLIVVMSLSWFLERRKAVAGLWSTAMLSGIIVGIPFLLILKQPDLGTALVLYPITLVIFYFGNVHPTVVKTMSIVGLLLLALVLSIFLGVIPFEELRPYATEVIKEYQYERLNPDTFHQRAAANAIAIGGIFGEGWRQGSFISGGWLPFPYTDSVFSSCGEIFGLAGLGVLLGLFYALIYCCFQVTVVAKDDFGRLLSAGVTVYLVMHIVVNIGMMLGFLPITGVPLVLITYGGSSTVATMMALGILQSIYSRRFMF
jgi:rod shape determining protein RodA